MISTDAGTNAHTDPLPTLAGMRVVVIEDEQRLADFVVRYLREAGHEAEAYHDGRTGLDAAWGPDVDAVVLDLMLPVMNGIEVCKRLRAAGNDVPIVMLTARGAVDERIKCLDAGADDYLVKPFSLAEL